jgi:hypothetical protein
MDWGGHVARIGRNRSVYRVSVGKREGTRTLGILVSRWGIILKWVVESSRRDHSGFNGCCTAMWKANEKTTTL